MRGAARLLDGHSAIDRLVEVDIDDAGGRLLVAGEAIPLSVLQAVPQQPGTYRRADLPRWRLTLDPAMTAAMQRLVRDDSGRGRWVDRLGLGRSAALFLAGSAALLGIIYTLPSLIAPNVPVAAERFLVRGALAELEPRICTGAGGQAALDRLAAAVGARPGDRVVVIRSAQRNAVALPGGTIVLFDELLRRLDSPDQAAGVVAHELGHVHRRHVAEAMTRQLGFQLILGAVGGASAARITDLVSLRYSRDVERQADADSRAALAHAGISPVPTARMFADWQKEELDGFGYLASHPGSGERGAAFRAAFDPGARYRPVLDRQAWDALVDICHNDPRQRELKSEWL